MAINKSNIFKFAREGNEKMQLEVLRHPLVFKANFRHGTTPLHWLARNGTEKVQLKVLSHPSVNIRLGEGLSPMEWFPKNNKLTKELLLRRFSWYKTRLRTNTTLMVEEIMKAPNSLRFIMED